MNPLALRSVSLVFLAFTLGACRSDGISNAQFESGVVGAQCNELDPIDAEHTPAVSLIEALATARTHSPEGQLLRAELGQRDGLLICCAVFWENRGLHELHFVVES